jgi:AraC-like DNA-binding protein
VAIQTANQPHLPLLEILQMRFFPLWQQYGMQRCLIAPHDLKEERAREKWLATGGRLSPCPYKGRRVAVKGPRNYDNRNTNLAYWPDDKLQERKNAVFACVIGGATDFQIGDQLAHCGAGHSMIILPGTPRPDGSTPHLAHENRKNGYCDLLWVGGEAEAGLGCWICHSEGERHFERPGESCHLLDPALLALFDHFLQEAAARRSGYRDICNHLFLALLMAMCREIEEGNIFQFNYQKAEAPKENLRDRKIHAPIATAQEYIKNHLHQALRIDDVARQVLLSRTEFTARFRCETGKSFHEYLTAVRLEEARRLLAETAWSIEMIGKAVSFQSSRLRVLFKRHYGISPQQFRKQNQQPDHAKTGRKKIV